MKRHAAPYGQTAFLQRLFGRWSAFVRPHFRAARIWLKPWRHKVLLGFMTMLLIVAQIIPFLQPQVIAKQYDLSRADGLLPTASPLLAKKLAFDSKNAQYTFNGDYSPRLDNTNTQGGAKITAKISSDASKGVTVTDPVNKTDFTLTPKMQLLQAKQDRNRVYYPLADSSGWLVYTMQANQVREDLVLTHAAKSSFDAVYELGLGKTMVARMLSDGSVGIYGSSLPINGQVSTGTDKDAALLQKLRNNSKKDSLLYTLPRPVIKETNTNSPQVQAKYVLEGSKLTLKVTGLKQGSYPIDIDPSVYVNSARGLMYGNNETNIDFDTSNNLIEKTQLTGASIPSWTSTTALPTSLWGSGTAVSGGYIYVVGGNSGSSNVSTVYWASLSDSDNTISSWTTNTAYDLPVALRGLSLVAYNDFLYAIGGNSGAATVSTVYKMRLAASGEPTPTWVAVTSLPVGLQYSGAVAYENELYVLGGQTSATGTTGVTTSYAAGVNPDGTIGSWSTTTALPAARYGLSAVTYNGYIMIVGGSVGGTLQNSVSYARITAAGTLNSWTSTNAFTTARQSNGGSFATIWGGYLYVSGGCSAANASGYCTAGQDDIQEASINADGSITGWTTLTGVTRTGFGHGLAAWKDALYSVGGCSAMDASTGACTTVVSANHYGNITSEGYIGPAKSQTGGSNNSVLPTAGTGTTNGGRMQQGVVINNGYIYNVGGCVTVGCATSGTTQQMSTATSYAAIAADGSLTAPATCTGTIAATGSVWCVDSTHTLNAGASPAGLGSMGLTVYNNVLYAAGGFNGKAWTNSIFYQPLNTTTGALTANWTAAAATVANASGNNFTFTRNGALYIMGGCSLGGGTGTAGCSTYYTSVSKCAITIATGAIPSCTTTGQLQLPVGLGLMAGTIAGNFIYLAGGANSSGSAQTTTVYRAKIDNTGNIVRIDNGAATGGWQTTTGSLTLQRRRAVAFAVNGYLYVIGGHDGATNTTLADAQIGKINTETGDITSFDQVTSAISARWDLRGAAANSNMYLLGGCTTGAPPDTCTAMGGTSEYVLANNNYSGSPAGYISGTQYATDRFSSSAVITNGYIYLAGGCTVVGCKASAPSGVVEYAPVNDDGSLGTWAATSTMTAARAYGKLLTYQGYVYALGGYSNGSNQTATATTERALVNANGTLGTWTADTSLPAARWGLDGAVYNGIAYAVGGQTGAAGYANTVYYSVINTATHAFGTWTATTAFTGTRSILISLAYNSTLYVIGGYNGTNYLLDVQFAKINANGTVGTWNNTANLPQAVGNASGFAANGYVYVVGGQSSDTVCTNNTYIASVNANSTIANGNNPTGLGAWSQTSVNFNVPRYGAASAFANGKIYVLGGGCAAIATGADRVYYSTLQSQPQIAKYSYSIDAGLDVFPSKSLFNGIDNGTGASWQLAYRSSTDAAATWGRTTNFGTTTLGTPQTYTALDASGADTSFARYYWIELTIDDSQAFGYPEDVSRGPTIANLTLQFTPNPSQRLRNGKTFINNVQQPLDANF